MAGNFLDLAQPARKRKARGNTYGSPHFGPQRLVLGFIALRDDGVDARHDAARIVKVALGVRGPNG